MSTLLQDLRYGARLLLKTPGFTLIAALSLALGIGANTTIFTLINAVLLNPLPVEDPSQLVSVWTTDELNRSGGFGFGFLQTSPMNYKDLRDKNEVFSGIAAHAGLPLNITGGTGDPQQVFGEIVTGNYFSVLGAKPAIGRGFLPDEDQKPGAKLVCVLGYGEWQKRFGGEPSIVGRTISLNGRQFTVVGVMPKGFKGTNAIGAPAVWVPYMTYQQTTTGFFLELIRPDQRRGLVFNVTGRLKPGVSVRQAEANLKTLARQLEQEYPNDNKGRNVTLVPLAQATINPGFRGNIVAAGGLLMTIVALVLLIACANVANLLLARAAARQKEIAVRLSLIALIGAGLFLRSLQNAQSINPGFDVERLATMSFDLGAQGYTEERGRQFQQRVLERAASVPGVQSATLASTVPLFAGGFARTVFLEGQDASDRRAGRLVQIAVASSHYLETLGIALVRGRPTSEIDQPNTPSAVVINETMAKRFWPDQDAIGKRFKFFGQDNFQQVVGIARDSKYNFVGEDPTPYIYQATTQVYQPQLSLFVKAPNPQAVIGTVRGEVQQLDRNLPLTGVFTLNEIFDPSLGAPRMGAWLLAVFAGLSLVLAVIGIYGVMAYSVSQRTRELGIRMALGAGRADVVRLVVLQGLRLTIAGVIVGLAVSLAVTRLVATLLFNVSPTDLVTFVAVPALLAVAALGASYLPALRATRIDPMIALRYE